MPVSDAPAGGGDPGQTPDPRVDERSPVYRRAMVALFCAGIATFAQMYSPQGLLPEIAGEFGRSAGASSWVVGATTIGVAVGVLPWALISDRIGRVSAMRWAICTAIVVGVAAPLMPTFEALVAVRLIEGLALAGLPAIAVNTLAETVNPRVLGGAIGTYVAGTTIGGLFGRIISAWVADVLGWRGGLLAVAVLAAVAAVTFLVLVPPTRVRPGARLPLWQGVRDNLRRPGVMVLVAQGFLLMGGFVAAYNYLAFRLQQPPFGLSLAQVSWIFLAYLAGAVASRYVWRAARLWQPTTVLLVCIGVMLTGLGLTLLPHLAPVIVGLVLFTAGFFGAHAISSGLIDRRAGAGRSFAPSMYNLGYYGGSSLLGWLGGLAFAAGGWTGTVAMIAGAALIAAAAAWAFARRG